MEPGTLLGGRFRLGAHLERSRQGEVFLARDEANGDAPCHVELITYSGFLGEEIEARTEREVSVCGRLKDVQGVLGALGWGRLGPDRLFVARAVIKDARPLNLSAGSLPDRLRLVLRVAERVGALHEAGAVHRDLSPLTVLTGPGPADVWLTGLGLAQVPGVEEPPLDVRGQKVSYLPCAAPELLEDPETATPATDVFALGVLLHQAMAGAPPFPGPTLIDLVRQQDEVRLGHRPLPPGPDKTIPKPVLEVCRRALPLDMSLRFPTGAVFAAELEKALGPLATPTPQPTPRPIPEPEPEPALVAPDSEPATDQHKLLSDALGESDEGQERLLALTESKILADAEASAQGSSAPEPVTSGLDTQKLWDPFESGDTTSDGSPDVEELVGEDTDEIMAPEAFRLAGEDLADSDPSAVIEVPPEPAPETPEPEPEPEPEATEGEEDAGFGTMLLQLEVPKTAVDSWKPATSRFKRDEVEAAKGATASEDPLEKTAVEEMDDVAEIADSRATATVTIPHVTRPEPESTPEPEAEPEAEAEPEPLSEPPSELAPEPAAALEPEPEVAPEPALADSEALISMIPALELDPAPAVSEEEEEEEEPEELSPEEALAALEAVTREVDVVPLHPPPATQEEVLEAFGPSDDAEAASPSEVLTALGLADSDSDLSAIEDASTDVLAALPEWPEGADPGLPLEGVSAEGLEGVSATESGSGRLDLGSLDLTGSEATPAPEPTATAAAPPPSALPLPDLPSLPTVPEPEPEVPVELLPPVAFDNLVPHGKSLVLTIDARDFADAVDCAHRVDPAGFDVLLLDMSAVTRLGGRQFEDLTAILTHADKKSIRTAMFGVRADLRQLITMMAADLGANNLPPTLAAQDLESALSQVSALQG